MKTNSFFAGSETISWIMNNIPVTGFIFLTAFLAWSIRGASNRVDKVESDLEAAAVRDVKFEERVTKVEEKLISVDKRLVVVETKLDALTEKVDAGFADLNKKFDKLDEKFDKLLDELRRNRK